MPQIVHLVTEAYTFDELDEQAKERARDWYREDMHQDSSDFDFVIDDFITIAEMIGVDFKTHEVQLMNGKTRRDPNIYWSGFCSQGDGACFEGTWSYRPDAVVKVREYAPQDEKLHAIVDELTRINTARILLGKSTWQATITHNDRYYHERSIDIDVSDEEDDDDEPFINPDVDVVTEAMRDLCSWLYKQLDAHNDYLYSAEHIDESITCNEYMFTKEGARHDYA
jgi:hypothetical protein